MTTAHTEDGHEDWRAIPGWEGAYEASSHGRIRSVDRWIETRRGTRYWRQGRLLTIKTTGSSGYYQVDLRKSGAVKKLSVHRLICVTFHGPCPDGYEEVRHLNDAKIDNRACNLAWGTKKQNAADALRNGRNPNAGKTECKWGHPFDESNTKIGKNGWRWCRQCHRDDAARKRARKAAA